MVGRFVTYRLFLDSVSFIYPTELDSEKERVKFNGPDYAFQFSSGIQEYILGIHCVNYELIRAIIEAHFINRDLLLCEVCPSTSRYITIG